MTTWAHVDVSRWPELPEYLRKQVGETLRDAFFRKHEDPTAFLDAVACVDEPALVRVDGLEVSFHPTRRFKAVRYFQSERVPTELRKWFARPVHGESRLLAGFIDPQALSFRSFENILSLDAHFASAPLALKLEAFERSELGELFTFALQADDATKRALLGLAELGLFVPPMNPSQRGGERFLFHCAALADALTGAFRGKVPESKDWRFVHVNPVFRCNRFAPGDAKFREHHDTPYFDARLRHVSRFTVLLYLSGGEGQPTLQVEGVDFLSRVEPWTGVLLDQQYAHEGKPFVEGDKVFLRTELIFEAKSLEHDARVGELFAKATYLSGESHFTPELSAYADANYERVAKAHWKGLTESTTREPMLLKRYRGTPFATNGYDFWFPEAVPLAEAAALALLDVFNAEVGGVPFRKACVTEVHGAVTGVPELLTTLVAQHRREPALTNFDAALWLPKPEQGVTCCPTHTGAHFDATLSHDVIELVEHGQRFVRERLEAAPVLVMGQEVFLNAARFVLEGDRLHVLSRQALEPVNFAACWNSAGLRVPDFVAVDASFTAFQPVVPPIFVSREQGCHHLRFDFFRNTWMVKDLRETVPVPAIRTLPVEGRPVEPLWLDVAGRLELPQVPAPKYPPWWSAPWSRLVAALWHRG